jgi:type I restriction enzyme R subunit
VEPAPSGGGGGGGDPEIDRLSSIVKTFNDLILELLANHTELFKQFSDNAHFKRWLTDTVFDTTYQRGMPPPQAPPQMGAGL